MNKILSRIWLGPEAMPDAYQEYGEKWKFLNPEWDVKDWTATEVFEGTWKNSSIIDDIISRCSKFTAEAATQIADVVSYELIERFGGIYVNVDIEPIRSIEYMYEYYGLNEDQAFAGYEDHTTGRIVNSVLGSPKNHPVWFVVIGTVRRYYWDNPLAEMVSSTGPVPLTDIFNYWKTHPKCRVLPTNAFNKVHWSQIPLGTNGNDVVWEDDPGVIGIHKWDHRRTGRSNLVR